MAQLIIILLYGIMFLLIKGLIPLEMSNEVRLAFNILGFITFLGLPLFIYSIIDLKLSQRAVNLVGENWCLENKVNFKKVEIYKNHFALIYLDGEKKVRKKFRIRFILTTWFIKDVEWL